MFIALKEFSFLAPAGRHRSMALNPFATSFPKSLLAKPSLYGGTQLYAKRQLRKKTAYSKSSLKGLRNR